MSHCVFLLGEYDPLPSANGICVKALVDEMVFRGNKVDVICNGEEYRFGYKQDININIHTVLREKKTKNQIDKCIHKFISIASLLSYPIRNTYQVKQCIQLLKKINEINEIDCVIVCQRPFVTTKAGVAFKEIFPDIKLFIYELDSLGNDLFNNIGWRRIFINKCKRMEDHYYSTSNAILHLECNRQLYESESYLKYRGKSFFVDIPLIEEKVYSEQTEFIKELPLDRKEVNMIYSGVLLKEIREPGYIIKLVKHLSEDIHCILTFYSRGSCDDELKKESCENDWIKSMGYVSRNVLDKEMAASDFLISIGNSLAETNNAVPSKIFVYMSTGKPIIHILSGDNDICKKYYENYPNILLIDPRDDLKDNLRLLKRFVGEKRGTRVPFEIVSETLYKNTPQYSVDVIENALHGRSSLRNLR